MRNYRKKILFGFCFTGLIFSSMGCSSLKPTPLPSKATVVLQGQVSQGFRSIGHLSLANKIKQKDKQRILVDQIMAIPVHHGRLSKSSLQQALTASLESNGKFALEIPREQDWLLVLRNSVQTEGKQFGGQITMPLAHTQETLLLLMASRLKPKVKTIDLGKIRHQDNQALVQKQLDTTLFTLSEKEWQQIAKNDAPLSGVKNLVNKDSAGPTYALRTDFKWQSNYGSLVYSFSHPYYAAYRGYNFQLDSDATDVTMNEICGSGAVKKAIELYPAAGSMVMTHEVHTYSSVSPMANDLATCALSPDGATEARDDDFYATNRYSNISYTYGGRLITDPIPGGLWDYKIDGVVQAQFDPSVAIPRTADNRVAGLVPGLKANTNTAGAITSFEVKWFQRDDAAYGYYNAVTDTTVITSLVEGGDVYLENQSSGVRRYESIHFEAAQHVTITPVNDWSYGDFGPVDQQAEGIGIHWSSGMTGYFIHYPRYVPPTGEVSVILPIPEHERSSVTRGQTYNLAAGHEGLDFGFDDWASSGGSYVLHDIIAPCAGVIEEINRKTISGSGNEAFSVSLRYNATRSILLAFEPDTSNTALVDLQATLFAVEVGDVVSQGQAIGQLVTPEPSGPYPSGAHVHWGIYAVDPATETRTPICPHSLCTPEEALALETLYNTFPGGAIPVCMP